jgi:hypothetical protein
MATLDELRLQQLLQPFEGPGGIASLNPLAFQYQDQQYLNQDPTQDFYQPNNLSPTQDFYPLDRNPTQMFYQPREFVNAPQDFYQPDLTTLRGLDMNRFQGVSDMSMIDETTNDEQDQEYIDQVNQSNNKFGGIMDLIGSIAIPGYGFFKNIARGGLEGLKGFGRRLGQSDFAQSETLMEYLGKRQAKKEAERLAPIQKQLREASERGGGYQPTTKSQNVARTSSRVSDGKTRAYGL